MSFNDIYLKLNLLQKENEKLKKKVKEIEENFLNITEKSAKKINHR